MKSHLFFYLVLYNLIPEVALNKDPWTVHGTGKCDGRLEIIYINSTILYSFKMTDSAQHYMKTADNLINVFPIKKLSIIHIHEQL